MLPFDGPVFVNIVEALTTHPTPDLAAAAAAAQTPLSRKFVRVVDKALAKNPDSRYPSAAAMLADLDGPDLPGDADPAAPGAPALEDGESQRTVV